jgi:hypothetical protein
MKTALGYPFSVVNENAISVFSLICIFRASAFFFDLSADRRRLRPRPPSAPHNGHSVN